MKKLLQKIGAVLLCACMLMPMCPEEAFADTIITEAEVNIEIPKVGEGFQSVIISVPEGANYTVELEPGDKSYWSDGGGEKAYSFTEGSTYMTVFKIVPAAGYTIASDATVKVNGSIDDVRLLIKETSMLPVEFKTNPLVLGTINEFELTNVPTGAIGEPAEQYSYNCSEYSVVGTWVKYDYTYKGYVAMDTSEKFTQGQNYRLELRIVLNDGYQMGIDPVVIIDGEYFDALRNPMNNQIWCNIDVNYSEEIDKVEINSADLPKAEVGKNFAYGVINVPVKDGSHYAASGYWTYYNDDTGMTETEGTFQDGEEYNFVLNITPTEGYSFSDECELYIDGEIEWDYNCDSLFLTYNARQSFKDVIDKVTLLNLPTASIGGSVKMGDFAVEVPADAPYTATGRWVVYKDGEGWIDVDTTTFEDGKKYRLSVSIDPKEGYEFSEATIVNAYGVDVKTYAGTDFTWFEKDFSFLKEISSVEITGYTEPKVGDDAAINAATLKVPADANYEIVIAEWWETTPEGDREVTTFEKGKDYALVIFVAPKAGYGFTRGTSVTINGSKVTPDLMDTELRVVERVSFKEVIPEVQVSNVPTVEIGKIAATDVKVPDGAKYDAIAMWRVWDDAKREYVAFEGTFEKGKVYELGVIVLPKDGYRFLEEETIFKIDGNTIEASELLSDRLIYNKGYQTEQKLIDRIELKIEQPVVGNHASIAPVITIVGDANFTVIDDVDNIDDLYWFVGTADSPIRVEYEYFVADVNYGVYFMIQANEGYVFSDDLTIVINGKVIPKDAYTNALKLADVFYFFGMGTEEVVDDGTDKENGVPKTGDSSNAGMFVSIMLVGMLAFCRAFVSRRRSIR